MAATRLGQRVGDRSTLDLLNAQSDAERSDLVADAAQHHSEPGRPRQWVKKKKKNWNVFDFCLRTEKSIGFQCGSRDFLTISVLYTVTAQQLFRLFFVIVIVIVIVFVFVVCNCICNCNCFCICFLYLFLLID